MPKEYNLQDILEIAKRIKSKAEAMTFEELDAMACGTGFLTFIDEEPDFAEWLSNQPDEDNLRIQDCILHQVFEIYELKANELAQYDTTYLLLERLNAAAGNLTEEQLTKLVDIAENPDICLNESEGELN